MNKVEFISDVPSIGCPSIPVKGMWGINVNGQQIGAIWFNPVANENLYDIIISSNKVASVQSLLLAKIYAQKYIQEFYK